MNSGPRKPVLRGGLDTLFLDLSIARLLGFVPCATGPRTDGAFGGLNTQSVLPSVLLLSQPDQRLPWDLTSLFLCHWVQGHGQGLRVLRQATQAQQDRKPANLRRECVVISHKSHFLIQRLTK